MKFYESLPRFQEVCDKLQNELIKDGIAGGSGKYGWKFLKLSTLINKINTVLPNFGFYPLQTITSAGGENFIETKVYNKEGSLINESCMMLSQELKNSKKNDKGAEIYPPLHEYGKQITYLRRYCWMTILNIFPEEEIVNEEVQNRAQKYSREAGF